ncbi:MAG: transcription antitermination factor NusB, partial [Pseudomonadota bacterium]
MTRPNSSGDDRRRMKSAARLYAVQALFQMEASGQASDVVIREFEEHRFGAEYEEGTFAEANVALFR